MLVIRGTLHKDYLPDKALVPNICTIRQFEDRLKLDPTGPGRGYLRSIMEAESKHIYLNIRNLGLSLQLRDKLLSAASIVAKNVAFNTPMRLDPTNWQQSSSGFDCKTRDCAKALDEVQKKPKDPNHPKNELECEGLSQLIVLLALNLAEQTPPPSPNSGNDFFNLLVNDWIAQVNKKLSKGRLPQIKFRRKIHQEMLQAENLAATGPSKKQEDPGFVSKGDFCFRPGDIVAFSNDMPEAQVQNARIWQVENGVCAGWKLDDQGKPISVGGGFVDRMGKPIVLTKTEMKEKIYQNTIQASGVKSPTYEDLNKRMKYFSIKALDKARDKKLPKRPDNIPAIELNTVVSRIAYLGGRNDVI